MESTGENPNISSSTPPVDTSRRQRAPTMTIDPSAVSVPITTIPSKTLLTLFSLIKSRKIKNPQFPDFHLHRDSRQSRVNRSIRGGQDVHHLSAIYYLYVQATVRHRNLRILSLSLGFARGCLHSILALTLPIPMLERPGDRYLPQIMEALTDHQGRLYLLVYLQIITVFGRLALEQ
jgi:hypothetical protein